MSNRADALLEEIVRTCAPYVSEVLIGFDGHADDLPSFFREHTRVIPLSWEGFGATKNKLAAVAANAWIWSLDGDELPDTSLLEALAGFRPDSVMPQTLLSVRRISFFEGKKVLHGAWGRDRVIRLYNREHSVWDLEPVHEQLVARQGRALYAHLDGILWHYTADSYAVFLEKNRRYARLSADKYFARGKRSPLWKRLLSPAFTFCKEYVFLGGFLDGSAGWKVACINAAYTRWKYRYLHEKYQESGS